MGIVVPRKLFPDVTTVGRATGTATMVKQPTIQVENSKFSMAQMVRCIIIPAADWL